MARAFARLLVLLAFTACAGATGPSGPRYVTVLLHNASVDGLAYYLIESGEDLVDEGLLANLVSYGDDRNVFIDNSDNPTGTFQVYTVEGFWEGTTTCRGTRRVEDANRKFRVVWNGTSLRCDDNGQYRWDF
jgi:hypothetical protein